MPALADFGIHPVTDPARIAAAEQRLRDFSLSESLSVDQAIALTREHDAAMDREHAAERPGENLLFWVAVAGALAYIASRFVAGSAAMREPAGSSGSGFSTAGSSVRQTDSGQSISSTSAASEPREPERGLAR